MGIPEDRPFHAAFDDALYTALIMQKMDIKPYLPYKSVDYYHLPESKEEEIYLEFPTYQKYVSMPYANKEVALKDKAVSQLRCTECGLPVRTDIKWFAGSSGNRYYGLVHCLRHGYVKGKIRIRKAPGDMIYVVKTVKPATEEDVKELHERKDAVKERRHKRVEKERERKKRQKKARQAAQAGVVQPAGEVPDAVPETQAAVPAETAKRRRRHRTRLRKTGGTQN